MATHSSILAWRIAWTEEPGGLQSLGLQRVRHNLVGSDLAAAAFPGGASGKEPICQFRRHRRYEFGFWVRKIP